MRIASSNVYLIYFMEHSIFFNLAKLEIMHNNNYHSEVLDDRNLLSHSNLILEKAKTKTCSLKGVLDLHIVCAERGCPASNAMISIDSIGLTAVCDHEGKVGLSNLFPGKYNVDIICAGYMAHSVLVCIEESEVHNLQIKMISNI